MQTFLPLPSLEDSVACLDTVRLGKQRVETLQLLQALKGLTKHARNHPACLMWEKNPCGLAAYGIICCRYYTSIKTKEGHYYADTVADKICDLFEPNVDDLPWWFGLDRLHKSHLQSLLFKDFSYYQRFGWVERPFPGYWWPVTRGRT